MSETQQNGLKQQAEQLNCGENEGNKKISSHWSGMLTLKTPFIEVTEAARPSLASKHPGHAPEDECFNTDIPLGLLIGNVAATLRNTHVHTQRTNIPHAKTNLQQPDANKSPSLTP